MPLEALTQLLERAQADGYAVPAFDVVNTEYAAAIVRVAQEERSPVVLMILEGYLRYVDLELLVPSLRELAGRASVPVAVHMDHATEWETVVRAVRASCTSIMLDCCTQPYDENVARTREVVRLCRPLGISVESELGSVLGDEAVGSATLAHSDVDEKDFTDVDEALQFVRDTEVDALAISVGTTHGLYKAEPKLDLDRIRAVAAKTDVPLVLHGSSGLADQDFRDAIEAGMRKVNLNTSLVLAAGKRLKAMFDANPAAFNYPELLLSAHQAVAEEARHYIRLFGCAGKA